MADEEDPKLAELREDWRAIREAAIRDLEAQLAELRLHAFNGLGDVDRLRALERQLKMARTWGTIAFGENGRPVVLSPDKE